MSHDRLIVAAVVAGLASAPGPAGAAPRLAITQIASDPCCTGISLLAPDGRVLDVLTRHAGWQDDDPSWSPGGGSLAFTRSTDGRASSHIHVMNSAGGAVRRITDGRFDERPAWSPDGRWIAYQAIGGTIRLVHPDGTADHAVPNTRGAASPAWSPGGGRIAYGRLGYVVSARVDGTARRRVARGREPDYSPDGRRIVYTGTNGGVFVVPAAGGTGHMLHKGMQPDWSPDGRSIVFTRWPGGDSFSVWVMRANGAAAHRVRARARAPAWRP